MVKRPSPQGNGRIQMEVCHLLGLRPELGAAVSTALGRVGGKMAEFISNSAIVELGRKPSRELPRYWTPERVRQFLATMPAGQPGLFVLLTG